MKLERALSCSKRETGYVMGNTSCELLIRGKDI